jgi:acetoin utilization deacetylase AcuC-like enzyme
MADTLEVHWHPDVLAHDTGSGLFDADDPGWLAVPELHAENAERVRNMESALRQGPYREHVRWRDGRHATRDELEWLHDGDYIDAVRAGCDDSRVFTRTTLLSPTSWPAVLAAAGTAIGACDAVLDGNAAFAYALVRPPGHHASSRTADGYCFFNNTALAAQNARRRGRQRVVILDWDVHHGNGTQTLFYDRDDVLTISWHMAHGSWGASHPETGSPEEVGGGAGTGFNVNLEFPLGSGDHAYHTTFDEIVAPIVDAYAPDMIIVASGQDANQFDPNGRQSVTMAGFRGLGERARALADRHTDGTLLLVQEGGYARTYSAACLLATVGGVLGLPDDLEDPVSFLPDPPGHAAAAIDHIRAVQARHWEVLR